MSFRESGFRSYFSSMASPNSVSSYLSVLRSIDRSIGGLDEAIGERGVDGTWAWAQQTTLPPFDTRRSDGRSILKRYLTFVSGSTVEDVLSPAGETAVESAPDAGLVFELERNMQAAIRRAISGIEAGLTIVDGGAERAVATGRIDILARDGNGTLTVIELKAGRCPMGAIEQALGYADSLSAEDKEPVRAILIAASFSDRQVAAARRVRDLRLMTYDYAVSFATVSQT